MYVCMYVPKYVCMFNEMVFTKSAPNCNPSARVCGMGRLRVAASLLLVVAAAAGVAPAAPGGGTLAAPQRRRLSARTSRKWQRAALGASLAAAAAAVAVAVALSSAAYFSRPLSDQRPRNVVAFFLAVLLLGADCALALPTRRKLGAAAYGVLVATIALTLAVNAYVVNVVAFDDRCSALDRFQDPRKTRRAGRHLEAFDARQCFQSSERVEREIAHGSRARRPGRAVPDPRRFPGKLSTTTTSTSYRCRRGRRGRRGVLRRARSALPEERPA